ncbi:MAG TPA: hypothetical protein VND64_17255 [Pirellulales bacterium]|nr:hypothetical protein [Pirellulales bacterium]
MSLDSIQCCKGTGYLALTGRYYPQKSSNPPPRPTDDPTYGALLQRLRPIGRFPYEAVHLNGPLLIPGEIGPGQDGGFLGRHYELLVLGNVNSTSETIPALAPRIELPLARLEARARLRETLDQNPSELEPAGGEPLPAGHRRGMLGGMAKPQAKIVSRQTNSRRCG